MRLTQYLFAHKGGGTGGAGSHAHMQKYLPISRSLRNGASELMVRQCPHAPPPLQAGGCSATSCGQRLPPPLAVPSTCAVAFDVCKVSRCMLVATDQHAKPKKPNAVKPPMRTPCGSCRRNAPDAPRPSPITPHPYAVSWRTSRAISESTTVAKNDDPHAQTRPDCPSRCRQQTHRKDPGDTALTTFRCLHKITSHLLVV